MAENEQLEGDNETPPPKKFGFMTLVKAAAFISVIVLIQIAGASMLFPSGEEAEKIAEQLAAAEAAQESAKDSDTNDEQEETYSGTLGMRDMEEVPLGDYHVMTYDRNTGVSMNVDFELYGTVLADESSEFFQLYEANKVRISEQIIVTIRSMDITDLSDPGLGLIKRKILEKTNRALGKPLLHEAVFSEFSFMER